MKRKVLLFCFWAMMVSVTFGQGTDGVIFDGGNNYVKDASAVFQAHSTSQGFLIPNVSLAATNSSSPFPAHPATGFPASSLLVYNTATAGTGVNVVSPGYYYNAGSLATPNWVKIVSQGSNNTSTAWLIGGNSGTTAASNYIGTSDGTDFLLKTNGAERWRILSGGTINAGNTNTASSFRLDVRDDAAGPQLVGRSTGGQTTDHAIGFVSGAASDWKGKIGHIGSLTSLWSLDFWTDEDGPITFWNNSAERMRIEHTSGNLGIGLTAPKNILHVYGAEGSSLGYLGVMAGGGSSGNSKIEIRGGSSPYFDYANDSGTDYDGRLILTGDDLLHIDGTNLGIATAAPLEKLHVTGNIRQSTLGGTGIRPVYADLNGTMTIAAAAPSPGVSSSVSNATPGGTPTSTYLIPFFNNPSPFTSVATATDLNMTSSAGGAATTMSVVMGTTGSILITAYVNVAGQSLTYYVPTSNATNRNDGLATYTIQLQRRLNGGAWTVITSGSDWCGFFNPGGWMVNTGTLNFAGLKGDRFSFASKVSINYLDMAGAAGTYEYKLVFIPGGYNQTGGNYTIYDRALNVVPLRH